jgi:hypothetical protein
LFASLPQTAVRFCVVPELKAMQVLDPADQRTIVPSLLTA